MSEVSSDELCRVPSRVPSRVPFRVPFRVPSSVPSSVPSPVQDVELFVPQRRMYTEQGVLAENPRATGERVNGDVTGIARTYQDFFHKGYRTYRALWSSHGQHQPVLLH